MIRQLTAGILTMAVSVGIGGIAYAAPASVTEETKAAEVKKDVIGQADPKSKSKSKPKVKAKKATRPKVAKAASGKKVAFLGIGVSRVSPAVAAQLGLDEGIGLSITQVGPGSPAEKAGVKVHDVLHKIGDQLLVNDQQMRTLIRKHKAGDEMVLTVIRRAKPMTIKVKLAERVIPNAAWQEFKGGPNDGIWLWRGDGKNPWRMKAEPFVPLDGNQNPDELAKRIQDMIRRMQGENFRRFGIDPALPDPNRAERWRKWNEQMRKRMDELQKQFKEDFHGQDGIQRNFSSTSSFSDGTHSLTLKTTQAGKHLKVKDRAGKVLFDGPINTKKQLEGVPKDVLPKLERLEKQTQFKFRFTPKPAPKRTVPKAV